MTKSLPTIGQTATKNSFVYPSGPGTFPLGRDSKVLIFYKAFLMRCSKLLIKIKTFLVAITFKKIAFK